MPIVTDAGFVDAPEIDYAPPEALTEAPTEAPTEGDRQGLAILLPNDATPSALAPHFDRIALIAVPLPAFSDGRAFSVARRLRALGYRGRLRAVGHVLVDQFAFARACGFDDVEIDAAAARKQPESAWLAAVRLPDYRAKLTRRAAPSATA